MLDFVGDLESTGKEPGNDVLTGKVTLPLIYAFKKAGKNIRKEMIAQLADNHNDKASFEKIFEFVNETGGIDYAYKRAGELSSQGLEAISSISESVYQQSLNNMVQFTIKRAS